MQIIYQREAMMRLAESICRKVLSNTMGNNDVYSLGLNEINIDENGYGWMRISCRTSNGHNKKVIVLVKDWRPAVMYLENK